MNSEFKRRLKSVKRQCKNESDIESSLSAMYEIDKSIRKARGELEKFLSISGAAHSYPSAEVETWAPELIETLDSMKEMETTMKNMRRALERYLDIADRTVLDRTPREEEQVQELSQNLSSIRNLEQEIEHTKNILQKFIMSTSIYWSRSHTPQQLSKALETIRNVERIVQRAIDTLGEEGDYLSYEPPLKEENEYREPYAEIDDIGTKIICRVEIMGKPTENIDVDVKERVIHISGKLDIGQEEPKEFCTRVILPTEVNPKESEAKYNDGVLIITLPKIDPTKDVRKIKVK
jgi:HSP20 family protein